MRCVGHSPIHPLSIHAGQPFQVVFLGKHLRLEPAHGIGACCLSLGASPSNDDSHGGVLGQPFSIVGVLVAGQTAVHRLPEQRHQLVLHVATAPALLQTGSCRLRQSQGIIQLTACQESGVRGDGSATKFQADSAVELELQRGVGAFTHWVPPERWRYPELDTAHTASIAHLLAMMPM